jgi:CheY-like chemotaxis protein
VSSTYSRVAEVNEKIRSVQLTITQWRVLFAINESTSLSEVTEYVEADDSAIKESLSALSSMGLISSETEDVVKDTITEEAPEEIVEEEIDVLADVEEEFEIAEEDDLSSTEFEEQDLDDSELSDEIVIEEEYTEEIDASDKSPDLDIEVDEGFEVVEEVSTETIVEEPKKVEAEPIKEKPVTVPETKGSIGGKTIMIIDDSIVIRKMVELAFEDMGMTIVGYASAKAAMDAFATDNPDILIVEPALPDTKGADLVKVLKEKKNIPVLMFSGKNASMEIDGVDDFVQKPFKDEDLVSKVQALVK